MRALFRDQYDNTLFAAEISIAIPYPEDNELQFFSLGGDAITIQGVSELIANSIIMTLYEEGKIDLSSYKAFLNEEPPNTSDR